MSESKQLRYSDLLDEALARIPALAPEWTDHNPADPGIALIELAAWLTETVLYRSTRVDDRSRRALLGLIQGADPDAQLTGQALEDAIRASIKALRRPFRAVTPRDYIDRIRADWPATAAAKALGLERQVADVVVLPRRDLEAENPGARRDAHVSAIVVPDRLCWDYRGSLAVDRPTLFITQDASSEVTTVFPAGGRVTVTGSTHNAVVFDGQFAPGEAGELVLDPAAMGTTGEYRITLDQANCMAGLNAESPGLTRRRLTGTDGTLLGCRFIPMRRNGDVEIVVTTEAEIPLKLEVRTQSGQLRASAEGQGVVALSVNGGRSVQASNPRVDWQCRLFAPEAEPGAEVEVTWHVQRTETFRRWDDAGGDPLLDGIWQFLDERRVIGTRHHVVGPRWVKIAIDAEIYLTDGTDPDLVRPRLLDALVEHFSPPGHDASSRGIGVDLHYTEVIAAIEAVPGVDYVDKLSLTPADRRLADGDEHYGLSLAPDHLVVLQVPASNLKLFERS